MSSLFFLKIYRFLSKIPLVRKHARKAAYNLALKMNDDVLSSIFTGQKMLLKIQDWVQFHLFIYSYYEKAESEFWVNYTKDKKVVFDVGANVGYFTLLASKNIASNGKIYSFEPISKTYNRFRENLELNKIKNVLPEKIAISNENVTLTLNIGNDNNWGMSSINNHDHVSGFQEEVSSTSIDEYLFRHNISGIDIIKIDVEGAEYAAILGMDATIKKYRPVVLIEVLDNNLKKQGYTSADVYKIFFENGYEAWEILNGYTIKKIYTPKSYDGLVCFFPIENPKNNLHKIQ